MEGQISLFDCLVSLLPQGLDIIGYIPAGHNNAIRRQYLSAVTGLSDRKMRIAIHKARRDHVILNLSNGNGYFLPDMNDPVDRKLLIRYVRQEESRLKSIGWALRAARRMLKRNNIDWRNKDAA
jgi:hypothetical protein|uniref:Uncharacterized protein n=1 Tax=Siphoviridae sp. ctWDo30 TaxID=2826360 RepID=A0A8S5N5Z1_9CAUD|nr:MAG TPA: hypothetical protein [Siphoviridae sp. ctWDo30]